MRAHCTAMGRTTNAAPSTMVILQRSAPFSPSLVNQPNGFHNLQPLKWQCFILIGSATPSTWVRPASRSSTRPHEERESPGAQTTQTDRHSSKISASLASFASPSLDRRTDGRTETTRTRTSTRRPIDRRLPTKQSCGSAVGWHTRGARACAGSSSHATEGSREGHVPMSVQEIRKFFSHRHHR